MCEAAYAAARWNEVPVRALGGRRLRTISCRSQPVIGCPELLMLPSPTVYRQAGQEHGRTISLTDLYSRSAANTTLPIIHFRQSCGPPRITTP